MTRHDSDSELAGRMGAPRRHPIVHLPPRGEQSSGFFDLDALFPVRELRMPPPLPARLPPPLPARRRAPPVPIEAPRLAARRATRRQTVGWFAVFVAWLAMMTSAVMVATQLPGHVGSRARVVVPAVAPAPVLAPAPARAAAPPVATPTVIATASGPAVVSFLDLPKAAVPARAHARKPAPRATRPAPAAAPPDDEAAPSSPPARTGTALPAAPPAPPIPAVNASSSLEDLIRHEVAVEQKRLHDNAGK